MTDIDTLIRRSDQELAAEVERQKANWAEVAREKRERGPRLEHFEAVAKHTIELLRPRLERFKPVLEATPTVREHPRALILEFAATVARVTLLFEVLPDEAVKHVRLECTVEIIPAWVAYDRHSVLEFPLDAVKADEAVAWFDERVVAFLKAYLVLVRQDADPPLPCPGRPFRPRRNS